MDWGELVGGSLSPWYWDMKKVIDLLEDEILF